MATVYEVLDLAGGCNTRIQHTGAPCFVPSTGGHNLTIISINMNMLDLHNPNSIQVHAYLTISDLKHVDSIPIKDMF